MNRRPRLRPAQFVEELKRDRAAEVAQSRAVTRFSEIPTEAGWKLAFTKRRHSTELVFRATLLASQIGVAKTARALGLKHGTVHNWYYRRILPATGLWCHENVLSAMELASDLKAEHQEVMYAVFRALKRRGLSYHIFRAFLTCEAIPCPPGLHLYSDAAAQKRAEECAMGLRCSPNPTFGPTAPVASVASIPARDAGPPLNIPTPDQRSRDVRQKHGQRPNLAEEVARLRREGFRAASSG